MEKSKRLIVLLLILLSGCQKDNEVACLYEDNDESILLEIKANYDDIYKIHISDSFYIPNSVLVDENKYNDLLKVVDGKYVVQDNKLVKEYDENLDDTYSLNKTIDYLRRKRFYCEWNDAKRKSIRIWDIFFK